MFYIKTCPEPESNQRHEDFQSSALPTELSGHVSFEYFVTLTHLCRECKEKIKKADVFLKNLIFKKTSAILWLQIYLAAR